MDVLNEQLQVFLSKALELSYKTDVNNTHLNQWFYEMMISQLRHGLSDAANIVHITDLNRLADVDVTGKDAAVIIYDSGDLPSFVPDAPSVCIFKRLSCIALIKCDPDDFEGNAPYQLGIEINRHTIASFKKRATHFLLPFDVLLYVEKNMLDKHGADALSTNLFNQNGYLFSPHVVPSIVTGLLTQGDLSNVAAFVAQPDMLRTLCSETDIPLDSRLGNRDINEDVLLSLKVFKYRYHLPINPESIDNLEEFETALQSGSPEISVKIGSNEVLLTKPPPN